VLRGTKATDEAVEAFREAMPDAVVTRVNLFGWSASGDRSLAEFFFYNLEAGKRLKGFEDVYFCPLYAPDLGHIFLRMLRLNLQGLYHVVSSECITKYDFGVRIARIFGFDPDSIIPISVLDSGLNAPRSPKLTLCGDKLASRLGVKTPDINSGLQKFHSHYLQGYPNQIRTLVSD